MTKSQQVATLLMRAEGCTYAEAVAVTGWPAISIPWHAKNNGLRLTIKKHPKQPKRYFGIKPKIVIQQRIEQLPLPMPASIPTVQAPIPTVPAPIPTVPAPQPPNL